MIKKFWPKEDLEKVGRCPFCNSILRYLAYRDVEDWTFHTTTEKWNYWRCKSCFSLYLNPRPTADSISRAYSFYYTHGKISQSISQQLKTRIRNEYFSHVLNVNLTPRIHLPIMLSWLLCPLKSFVEEDFGLSYLGKATKGKLLDVGCGDGRMLQFAKQIGWEGLGVEFDTEAVRSCRILGLNVIEGDLESISKYTEYFDCIIFSHVVEHLYDPIAAFKIIKKALKPKGVLLLSCPNATSIAGKFFGKYWRGLEAPRHLAIPSHYFLHNHLSAAGFIIEQRALKRLQIGRAHV